MNGQTLRVWLVDDDASICWVLERALRKDGMTPRAFDAVGPALDALDRAGDEPDVLMTDIQMPGQSGLELLRRVREIRPCLPVIVMTGHSDLGNAVSAFEGGAFEYLPKPFDLDRVVSLVRRAATTGAKSAEDPELAAAMPELLGNAQSMQLVFRAIGRLSRSSATVLITGEPGTGKALVARALHVHSPRSGGPFGVLNISAIPTDLQEAEVFGCEGSAQAGMEMRPGRLEEMHGGTLFLDEIGDMSAAMQSRLLRVLTDGEFCRVGGRVSLQNGTRIIAGTRWKLCERVEQGKFREDLYHQLNAIEIQLPPLRARSEDIPLLLSHYLNKASQKLGASPKTLTKAAQERLLVYRWPGNVRELVNLCMRLSVLAPGNEIRVEDLPADLANSDGDILTDLDWVRSLRDWADRAAVRGQRPLLDDALPQFERALIGAALNRTQGHRREAAELLGWGRNTLTQKIRDLGMGRDGPDEMMSERPQ